MTAPNAQSATPRRHKPTVLPSRTHVPCLVALLIGLALIAVFPAPTLVVARLLLGYKG